MLDVPASPFSLFTASRSERIVSLQDEEISEETKPDTSTGVCGLPAVGSEVLDVWKPMKSVGSALDDANEASGRFPKNVGKKMLSSGS